MYASFDEFKKKLQKRKNEKKRENQMKKYKNYTNN